VKLKLTNCARIVPRLCLLRPAPFEFVIFAAHRRCLCGEISRLLDFIVLYNEPPLSLQANSARAIETTMSPVPTALISVLAKQFRIHEQNQRRGRVVGHLVAAGRPRTAGQHSLNVLPVRLRMGHPDSSASTGRWCTVIVEPPRANWAGRSTCKGRT
jgi:hypothetical protein